MEETTQHKHPDEIMCPDFLCARARVKASLPGHIVDLLLLL